MSDSDIEAFYHGIFADLTIDSEEASELKDFLTQLNPPPDKLVKLRATAFKVACDYLSEDDNDKNVQLLRTINYVVHAMEEQLMEPKTANAWSKGNVAAEPGPLDEEAATELFKSVYDELTVTTEESQDLNKFFQETNPPDTDSLVATRALAFKIACDFLSSENSKQRNIELLRCVNVIVHCFETSCLQPKPYQFQLKMSSQSSNNAGGAAAPAVGDLGAMSLSDAVQHLWACDANRLTPGDDYVINVQKGKKPYQKEDTARDPLFTRVDAQVWQRPTYKAFTALLDNYIAATGAAESVTDSERAEVQAFLDAVMQTAPMQFCHLYCHKHKPDAVPSSQAGFKKLLHSIWFDLYRRERGGRLDSSGFEHVFIGEVKNGDVSGFHNWIQFYLEEKKGTLDYRGYIKPRSNDGAQHDDNDHLLTLQFAWNGVEKFVGTSFIGVSPEFEMALYTMCFLVGTEENEVNLDTGTGDTFGIMIKCYRMAGDKIGTTFPEVTSHFD